MLNVKQEVHNITILHNVLLALDTDLTHITASLLGAKHNIIIILDNLGTDKTSLEIGMDNTCSLGSLHALDKCPCTALVSTSGEEGLKIEQFVRRLDKTSHT